MCRHCDADAVDAGQPETHLCPYCLDLAVWGAACWNCGSVPTGLKRDKCEEN